MNHFSQELHTASQTLFAWQILMSFLTAALYMIYLQGPKRTILSAGLIGFVGRSVLALASTLALPSALGIFLGSVTVALLGEVFARLQKVPVTVFIIGGFIPLIPGIQIYRAMVSFIHGDLLSSLNSLSQGLMGVMSIGAGAAVVTSVVRYLKTRVKTPPTPTSTPNP